MMILEPVEFEWKPGNRWSGASTGLIAQDVQKVIPEAVTESENGLLKLELWPVIAHLIKAIQELNNHVGEKI